MRPCACAPLVAAMRGLWRWLQHGAGQKGLTRHARRWQATVYVDSVCSKCLQCFFVTDGGTSRPPQQQAPQQAQQAQQASQLTNQPPPGQLPVSSPPVGGQPAHGAPQHGAPHGALLPHRRRCVPMFVANLTLSAWLKFWYSTVTCSVVTGISILGVALWYRTQSTWGWHLLKKSDQNVGFSKSRFFPPEGLPFDWHARPRHAQSKTNHASSSVRAYNHNKNSSTEDVVLSPAVSVDFRAPVQDVNPKNDAEL